MSQISKVSLYLLFLLKVLMCSNIRQNRTFYPHFPQNSPSASSPASQLFHQVFLPKLFVMKKSLLILKSFTSLRCWKESDDLC